MKKGRAYYVNDFLIRLNMSDSTLPEGRQKSEVEKMDQSMTIDNTNKLYFNPRKWSFNKACTDNVGSRSFITGPDGVLAEGYMIGDWSWKWTEIVSETLLLPQNTDCSFTFWLNGGENDRQDEVCRLDIIFDNDHEQRLSYNLNRNYIRPLKKLNGWELYEIPFRTQNNAYTELRFVAQRAYMTILTAKDASAYEGIPDSPDPFEARRPQRHNLIFSDGFPANSWYSTKNLQDQYKHLEDQYKHLQTADRKQNPENADNRSGSHENPVHAAASYARQLGVSAAAATKQIFDRIKKGKYASAEDFEDIVENKGEVIRGIVESALRDLQGALQQISHEFQSNAKVRLDAISASLDTLSSTCDMLQDFDVESIAGNIESEQKEEDDGDIDDILSDAADSISDIADELRDSIEEMTDRLEEIRESLSV